jgi:Ni/Co efflux regulator RcnB
MTSRRTLLTTSVAAIAALAGCAGQNQPAESKTTRTRTTSPTQTSTTTTETATTSHETTTTNTRPPLNETPYSVFRSDIKNDGITEPSNAGPNLVLLTTGDWRDTVYEQGLRSSTLSFIENTSFDSESVVVLEAYVGAGLNRWILESVNGVGTKSLVLQFREWESGSGLNNQPRRLVLVRLPHRETEPGAATAHLDRWDSDSTETVSTSR